MIVGLYVYGPTKVEFEGQVKVAKLGVAGEVVHSDTLEKGIYRVHTESPVKVISTKGCEMIILEDKDPWPDPRTRSQRFDKEFADVSDARLKEFFPAIARGLGMPTE
jgi:hypothetical protein